MRTAQGTWRTSGSEGWEHRIKSLIIQQQRQFEHFEYIKRYLTLRKGKEPDNGKERCRNCKAWITFMNMMLLGANLNLLWSNLCLTLSDLKLNLTLLMRLSLNLNLFDLNLTWHGKAEGKALIHHTVFISTENGKNQPASGKINQIVAKFNLLVAKINLLVAKAWFLHF